MVGIEFECRRTCVPELSRGPGTKSIPLCGLILRLMVKKSVIKHARHVNNREKINLPKASDIILCFRKLLYCTVPLRFLTALYMKVIRASSSISSSEGRTSPELKGERTKVALGESEMGWRL